MRQQRPLGDYPGDVVTVACRACARRGRYPKARLVERHGEGFGLVSLLLTISADCPKAAPDPQGVARCEAYFVELDAAARG